MNSGHWYLASVDSRSIQFTCFYSFRHGYSSQALPSQAVNPVCYLIFSHFDLVRSFQAPRTTNKKQFRNRVGEPRQTLKWKRCCPSFCRFNTGPKYRLPATQIKSIPRECDEVHSRYWKLAVQREEVFQPGRRYFESTS